MNLTRQSDLVSKSREASIQERHPLSQSCQDKEGLDAPLKKLEQAVASLKAAGATSPSADKGSRSSVGMVPPLTCTADPSLRASANAASLRAEEERPTKGRRAIRVFAAFALFFTGYVAALLTDFAAPELINKFGIRATEFGDLGQSSSALNELAALRRDLQVAREETSLAKANEAEWMRVFAQDDTKALALSRDLEAARKEITEYVATVSALRAGLSQAKHETATAEAKVQELTRALLEVERDKRVSLTRDREDLIARGGNGTAGRNELLQEPRTSELTESEWKRRLDSAIQELDRLRSLAPMATDLRQLPSSVFPAPESQPAPRAEPLASWALLSDGSATSRLANRPPSAGRVAAEGLAKDETTLLARAEYFLSRADIAGARRFLESALAKGSARAALMLAQTYDAQFLQSLQTVGVRPDRDKARQFYQAAAAGGIAEATERLRTLD